MDEEDNFKAKGDIFTKRTITKARVVEHVDTAQEALILSISEKGHVDFPYMESLTGKDGSTLRGELQGEIFLDIQNYDHKSNARPFSALPKARSSPSTM